MAVLRDARMAAHCTPLYGNAALCPLCFYEVKEPHFVLVHAGDSGCAADNVQACHWLLQFKTHKEKEILHSVCLHHLAGGAAWHE